MVFLFVVLTCFVAVTMCAHRCAYFPHHTFCPCISADGHHYQGQCKDSLCICDQKRQAEHNICSMDIKCTYLQCKEGPAICSKDHGHHGHEHHKHCHCNHH